MSFSVITSVYQNDDPRFVRIAFESIASFQTDRPSEVIVVVDGPTTDELNAVLAHFESYYPGLFKVIRLSENKGLGNALRIGVENASNEIIARMDSDDISLQGRFSAQLLYLEEHPEVSIVGGQITEFIDQPSKVVSKRIVPLTHDEIMDYMRKRCPMNHVTVMFRKSEIQRAGGYMDWPWNEDYYLWVRMATAGCRFANLPDVLVNVRVGEGMYARRGGWGYFKSEQGIQRFMLEKGLISFPRYLVNVAIRFTLQVLMPDSLRAWAYNKYARR
jgi:glycosyltransferase involved in cell wall biosynthesis